MLSSLTKKLSSLLSQFGKQKAITEQDITILIEHMHEALLQADVPYELATRFCSELQQKMVGSVLHEALNAHEQATKIMYDHLKQFLSRDENKKEQLFAAQSIMVLGLQGSGKTTTLAKIAYYIKKKNQKNSLLLSSVDFYRPAAIDQLAYLARTIGVDFYRAVATNPLLAAQEIQQYAQKHNYDTWLLDTAGRLHVDSAMVQEVVAIYKAVNPAYTLLVLDAMTGQESLAVARGFAAEVPFDGAALSKMDSDARGGAAFSFSYALQKPIVCLGVGEKPADMELFWPDRMASRLLGYGDIATLAEKTEEKIKQSEQQALYKAYAKGHFSLQDFADQLSMVSRIGSVTQLMKYIPGTATARISSTEIEQAEKEMKKCKAIISSMTLMERYNPDILDKSRKKRVALGAGVTEQDVNLLLSRFEQSKQYVKLLKKSGLIQRFFK